MGGKLRHFDDICNSRFFADVIELESQLSELPRPPEDLPGPWDWGRWQGIFTLAYFAFLFFSWRVAIVLDLKYLSLFAGAWAFSTFVFAVIGIYLIDRFSLRGYHENFSKRTNAALNRAVKRYRKTKPPEALHQILPRYSIEGKAYYLVWYVPGTTLRIAAHLSGGSEPLLFGEDGDWLSDEKAFNKTLLMWSYGLEISPRSFPFDKKIKRDFNRLGRLLTRYFAPLPDVLEMNREQFKALGLESELERVRDGYLAKCAFYRNTLSKIAQKIAWADAYGWDSLCEMRYEDVLHLHERNVEVIARRVDFLERHRFQEIELAAAQLMGAVIHSRNPRPKWAQRKTLKIGLEGMADPIPPGDPFPFDRNDGEWQSSQEILDAFRSRVAYAREVDAAQSK